VISLSEFFEFCNSIMLAACIIIHLFQKQDEHVKTAECVISVKEIHYTNHIIFQIKHDIIYFIHVCEKSISIFKKLKIKFCNKKM